MLFDTKFDLVVSIGEDCACSSYLRRCKLQDFSYPFDWLTKASFQSRLDLILNDFSNFLDKNDLYPLEKPKTGIVDEKCDYWADKRYDFYFYHDFPIGEQLEQSYIKVKGYRFYFFLTMPFCFYYSFFIFGLKDKVAVFCVFPSRYGITFIFLYFKLFPEFIFFFLGYVIVTQHLTIIAYIFLPTEYDIFTIWMFL